MIQNNGMHLNNGNFSYDSFSRYSDASLYLFVRHGQRTHFGVYPLVCPYLTIYIIRVTLNTEPDTLQFVKVDGPMEKLRKIYNTSPERFAPGVVFKLIDSVLFLPSEFENHTFCLAEYSNDIAIVCHFDKILACITNYCV